MKAGGNVRIAGVVVVCAIVAACGTLRDQVSEGETQHRNQRLQWYAVLIATEEAEVVERLSELEATAGQRNVKPSAVSLRRARVLTSMFGLAKTRGRRALLRHFAAFQGTNPTQSKVEAWLTDRGAIV